jgi:hypothetical protein
MLHRLKGLLPSAIDALECAVKDGTTGERLTAAKEIFDRTWGKARQHVETEHNHTLSIAQEHVRVLQSLTNGQRLIDVTPEHDTVAADHSEILTQ